MSSQEAEADDPANQDEEPGWQDTDSEGVMNELDFEDVYEDAVQEQQELTLPEAEQQHQHTTEAAMHQPNAQRLMQGMQFQELQNDQQHNDQQQDDGDERTAAQQQQLQLQQQDGDQAADTAQRRPLQQHIAAMIHRRVQALLRRALNQAVTAEDTAALQALLQDETDAADADVADSEEGSEGGSGCSSSSEGSSQFQNMESDEPDETVEGCTRFDPNVTASHQYLGDVDELEGTYGLLPEGTTARLPLLMLDGVVLFPGCQLPLLLSTSAEQHLLDRALSAPPPFTRLLAVLPGPRSWLRAGLPRLVACTAEVRQMRRTQSNDDQHGLQQQQMAVLALGRQRAEVVQEHVMARSQSSVLVRILSEGCQTDVPQPLRRYESAIHPALAAPWDLRLLVNRVRQLIQLVLMPVASFQGSPLELSYWVSHNLPLQPSTRQLLLTASCPAERLRLLLGLLERLDQLGCSVCGAVLSTTAEVLAMTSEGIAGTFVNSHGYVHEMVTFKRVHGVHLEGRPETAHSWFPGYAWTIAYCGTCGQHLGWRFTAVEPALAPRVFWGLRRQVLTCSSRPGPREQQHQQQGGADGTLVVIQLGDMPLAAAVGDGAAERER